MAKHTEYRDILESMSMNDIPEDLTLIGIKWALI